MDKKGKNVIDDQIDDKIEPQVINSKKKQMATSEYSRGPTYLHIRIYLG